MQVKATREGLKGFKTSSGYTIDTIVPFVALPSEKALGRFIRIFNPLNSRTCDAVVLDVGPFNINDDDYVFNGKRPLSEQGISLSGDGTNKAGIDLSEKVWKELDMKDNTDVNWWFID